MRENVKNILNILSWLLLLVPFVLILLFVSVRIRGEVPELFGRSLYVIVSPSMEPVLKVGDVILAETYGKDTELCPGDVVTYRGRGQLAGKLITHEVVALSETEDGLTIVTKGRANAAADPAFSSADVQSVMRRRLPLIGGLYRFLMKPLGFLLLFVIPMAWFILAEVRGLRRELKEEAAISAN